MGFSVLSLVIGLVLGAVLYFAFQKMKENASKKTAQVEADKIINRAKSESTKIMKNAERKGKDFEVRAKKNAEKEIRNQKEALSKQEHKMKDRQNNWKKSTVKKKRSFSSQKEH